MNDVSLETLEQEKERFKKKRELDDESMMVWQQKIKKVSKEEATQLGKKLYEIITDTNYNDDCSKIESTILEGADVNYAEDRRGNFPLLICARKNYIKTFLLLLRSGADINKVNHFLTSTTMKAAQYGRTRILNIACAMKADINSRCLDGDTALMSAKRNEKVNCFTKLAVVNAHINASNLSNESIFEITGTVNHPLFASSTTQPNTSEDDLKVLLEEARKEMEQILKDVPFSKEPVKQKVIGQ